MSKQKTVLVIAKHDVVQATGPNGEQTTFRPSDGPTIISVESYRELLALGAIRSLTKAERAPTDHDGDGKMGGIAPGVGDVTEGESGTRTAEAD